MTKVKHTVFAGARRMTMAIALISSAAFISSCDDDDDNKATSSSVQGRWAGTKTEVFVKFDGIEETIDETDDSFSGRIEFLSNGIARYTEDGEIQEGTWSQNKDKLTLTIPDEDEDVDMSGVYTIKQLTGSKLKLFIEKEADIEDPDSGVVVSALIQATLYFDKD